MGSEEITPSANRPSENRGVFVTKGMQVTIPEITIRIGSDGKLETDPVVLHVGLDMCPYWIEIALKQLKETEIASKRAHAAHEQGDNETKAESLRTEFLAGMQTIVASSVAMDSFYASVKELIAIPDDVQRAWRENKTARYKQTAEVFKRAFPISPELFDALRPFLKDLASFRGRAVHPPPGTDVPVHHPDLDIVTEWRYVAFRFHNAKAALKSTLSIIALLGAKADKRKNESLSKYCKGLLPKLEPLVETWEAEYGPLHNGSPPRPNP